MHKFVTATATLFAAMILCIGCGGRSAKAEPDDLQTAAIIVTMELLSARSDLELWDILRAESIESAAINKHISLSIIRHILTIRALGVNIETVKGGALETLCLLTTEPVNRLIRDYSNNDRPADDALSYTNVIHDSVHERVRRSQAAMLGTGCSLTP